MDKRLFIVLPVCLVIVIGWQLVWSKMHPPPPRPLNPPAAASSTGAPAAPGTAPAPAGESPKAAPAPISAVERAEKEETRTLLVGEAGQRGSYRAVFSNRGGALVELQLGDFQDRAGLSEAEKADPAHWTRLLTSIDSQSGKTRSFLLRPTASGSDLAPTPLDDELWTMKLLGDEARPSGIEFRLAPGTGVVFVKRFRFRPGTYELEFELALENVAREGAESRVGFVLTPAACMPPESADQYYIEPQAIAAARTQDSEVPAVLSKARDDTGRELSGPFSIERPPLAYAGVQNKYFAVLLRGVDTDANARESLRGASWRLLRDEAFAREYPADAAKSWKQVVTDVQLELVLPVKGQSKSWSYRLYAGPKERATLDAAYADHAQLTRHDLGFFNGIASVLLGVLGFLHGLARNWGVAIILLTLLVRALLFPINRRSQTAMARYQSKMKRIQPKIEELKKRYADDKSKLNQEQAKLLQAEGAFPPLGGCLPMFLQIPVFFGLFAALRVAFDLRQASFLWIPDLSLPDHTIPLGWNYVIPVLGWDMHYFNILPPIMIAMWIWQQRGMPMPADEQAAKMQKMMMWMPIVMGVFLYNYAAGLSLYMITQSGLGVFEQKFIKKHWPPDTTEQPAKKGVIGRMMERAQEAQKEAERLKRQRDDGRGKRR